MNHHFRQGSFPLLVSIPHNGSRIPEAIASSMTSHGRTSRDTDWFLDRLYDIPELSDASMLVAEYSRYVIDLNRPDSNESLYPGQTTTGLIPLQRFDGEPIWESVPGVEETANRIETFWRPYHRQIESELDRMVQEFGVAVLIEAHSIESQLPRLFEGSLADFNIGTDLGKSCGTALSDSVMDVLKSQSQYTHVLNGRFVGGFITRNYGEPSRGRHSIQFELSQVNYMDELNKIWDDAKAAQVQVVIRNIISRIKVWVKTQQN
jgi:N-formylglutamate deformylase